jgi:2-keto-3-deoxy-L-fuconate dehydrogenase
MKLKDKVAIITGAAAGIGEASFRLFAAEGAVVVGVDRDSTGLDRVVEEIRDQGLTCHGIGADVTSSTQCREAVDWTVRELGRIDILFNNAGIVHQGTLLEATEEDWDRALDINVKSMFRTCRQAVPVMLRQGSGNIINTASVAGFAGVVKRGVYSVSKAAVVGLTKSLAIDYVSDGIRANCICPGTVDTPSLKSRIDTAANPKQARLDFIARQPMGRLCQAEEIAALALYLASDDSIFMTGQAVVIDGAMTL